MAIHPDLVELIRCPKCRGDLVLRSDGGGLSCAACQLLYPIVDDIPQLLIDEARPLAAAPPGS